MISSVLSPAIGASSLSKSPSLVARAAFSWLAAENSSSSVAREAPLGGDQLGADALRHQAVGVAARHAVAEWVAARQHRAAHRHPAHGFHAGGDHHVVGAGDDALGGETDGLLAAAALAVDRGARNRLREARAQQGIACDVDGLIAHLRHRSRDDVVDLARVHAGALDELTQAVRQQVCGQHAVQCAVGLALADRRAYRAHDDGVSIVVCHDSSLSLKLSIALYTQL